MDEKTEFPFFYDTVIDLIGGKDGQAAIDIEITVREDQKDVDVPGEIDRITKIKAYSVNEAVKAYLIENPSLTRDKLTVKY